MSFDAVKFLKVHNILYETDGKNCSKGWVNICCPFCNDFGFHLGINLIKPTTNCWKCGSKQLVKLVSALLKIPYGEARRIIKRFFIGKTNYFYDKTIITSSKVKLPCNTISLNKQHINYLEKREFDSEKLQWEFGLLGTGPFGNYCFRIIAPIYRNGKLISYQGRDITNLQSLKYMACRQEEEVFHYKHTLYNIDRARTESGIICEGIADVWRIGEGALATFGIGYTNQQIIEIASRFNRVFLLYDNEENAIAKAENLGWSLSALGLEAILITDAFEKDPGAMKELDAKYLRKELLGY